MIICDADVQITHSSRILFEGYMANLMQVNKYTTRPKNNKYETEHSKAWKLFA